MSFGCASSPVKSTGASANNSVFRSEEAGFQLTFNPSWSIWSRVDEMPEIYQQGYNQLVSSGFTVFYVGNRENRYGCRAMGEVIDVSASEYFDLIKPSIENEADILSTEVSDLEDGSNVVVAAYQERTTKMIYLEMIIPSNQYVLRIAFWSQPADFQALSEEIGPILETLDEI